MNEPKQETNSDFIERYISLFEKITDASIELLMAAALLLLSCGVRRGWLFQTAVESSIFKGTARTSGRLLNLWFIIIGKSRVSRKTSAVVRPVVELCTKIFGARSMLTEAFTPESLISQMSRMAVPSPSGEMETNCIWPSDEISWFFQQIRKNNSYMSTTDAFLCKAYDGDTYTRGTISRGEEKVPNPYLTIMLASTDFLPTLFDELQIRLGFLNRFIFVIAGERRRKPLRTEPLTEEEKKEAMEIEDFLKALAEKTSTTMLQMSPEAKQTYDTFEEDVDNRIESGGLGIKEGYMGQLPNLTVRLSCLFRIGRLTTQEVRDFRDPVLIVEKVDAERAIEYAWRAWGWFSQIIDIMNSSTKSKPLLPINIAKAAILECLLDGSEKHVSLIIDFTGARVHASIATIYNALNALLKEGKIEKTRHGYFRLKQATAEESK